jgi:hypothetical protein
MSVRLTDPIRELDHRSGNGLEVVLVWYPASNEVVVHVFDSATESAYRAIVDPANAADAFLHPFAYVAQDDERREDEEPRLRLLSLC